MLRLDVFKAIRLVGDAGGVAGLAHPPFNLRLESLAQLVTAGLGAIEVAGPEYRTVWAAGFVLGGQQTPCTDRR